MANTTYEPRFAALSEGKDYVRIYAVINYTVHRGKTSEKKVIRFAVKNLITGKSYKIKKSLWNKKDNRCYVNRGTQEDRQVCIEANRDMLSIVKAVSNIVNHYKSRKVTFSPSVLTAEKIYDEICKLDEITVSEEPTEAQSITNYWATFIEGAKKGEIRHKGKKYGEGTIKGYQKCLNSLLEFQKQEHHIFSFDEIDMNFYTSYTLYLEERLITNSIAEHWKKIKHIMTVARYDGLHTNIQYENFSIVEEEVDNIYLTEDELKAIAELELTGSRLDKYRDIFLIGCYVGLRVSDLLRIRKEHFYTVDGKEILRIRTKKCPTGVYIPFLWQDLKYRLDKYDYSLPKITEQHLRSEAKEIGRLAGINSPIIIETGKHKRSKPYEKWELISSHTCRRTACTNMFKMRIPVKQIMMISGHKKESTFYKYIKISAEENAIMLSEQFGAL